MTFIKPTRLRRAARTLINDQTAAVIVEPVQGVAGAVDMPKEFLQALRFRCSENGSVLIFDEVQCGVGRTGYPFAANMYGVTPDIITTAKALGAGFPVSAMLVADHVAPNLKIDSLWHDVRRRPDGLRDRRSRRSTSSNPKTCWRTSGSARRKSARSASSARSSARKAPACCWACALRVRRRTCRPSC